VGEIKNQFMGTDFGISAIFVSISIFASATIVAKIINYGKIIVQIPNKSSSTANNTYSSSFVIPLTKS